MIFDIHSTIHSRMVMTSYLTDIYDLTHRFNPLLVIMVFHLLDFIAHTFSNPFSGCFDTIDDFSHGTLDTAVNMTAPPYFSGAEITRYDTDKPAGHETNGVAESDTSEKHQERELEHLLVRQTICEDCMKRRENKRRRRRKRRQEKTEKS